LLCTEEANAPSLPFLDSERAEQQSNVFWFAAISYSNFVP